MQRVCTASCDQVTKAFCVFANGRDLGRFLTDHMLRSRRATRSSPPSPYTCADMDPTILQTIFRKNKLHKQTVKQIFDTIARLAAHVMRPGPVPMGFLEALPTVRAQEEHLPGGGMRRRARAAAARLQPGRGRAVGGVGDQQAGESFLRGRGSREDSPLFCLCVFVEVLRVIVVRFGSGRTDYMRRLMFAEWL